MKNENEWDAYIRKVIKDLPEDEMPVDFTKKVMAAVQGEQKYSSPVNYTPVFSKFAWLFIAAVTSILLVAGYAAGDSTPMLIDLEKAFGKLPISFLDWDGTEDFSGRRILIFAIPAICGFLSLQILLLKQEWDRKRVYY